MGLIKGGSATKKDSFKKLFNPQIKVPIAIRPGRHPVRKKTKKDSTYIHGN